MQRSLLPYLGVTPFVFCLLLAFLSIEIFEQEGQTLFVYYSIAIANFMAGTLWLNQQKVVGTSVAVWSNILSLATLPAFVLPPQLASILLAAIFICVLFIELRAHRQGDTMEQSYIKVRVRVTSLVVLLHFILFFI